MLDLEVIDDPAAAVALDPAWARLLAGLAEPASASALAERVDPPPPEGQLPPAHPRGAWAGHRGRPSAAGAASIERVLHATAASYAAPGALGEAAGDPDRITDRLSARYLIALAARAVREVAALVRRAEQAGKRLPTLALDTEIRFRSAAERAAFTSELADAVTTLVSRYHDAGAPGGAPTGWWWWPIPSRPAPNPKTRRHHEQRARHPGHTPDLPGPRRVPRWGA